MSHLKNSLFFGYINTLDINEKIEDSDSINDSKSLNFEQEIDQDFQQCFINNFENNSKNYLDLDSDNEYEISNLENFEINESISNENKEKTSDKSREKSFIIFPKKSNYESEKTLNIYKDINYKNINNLINNKNENNKINISEKKENSEEKIYSSDFLSKKRKIFGIYKSIKHNYSKKFKIFIRSDESEFTRKIINQILQDQEKNLKEKKTSSKSKKQKKKRIKIIMQRKDNSDNIRKKIKARFLKALKIRVNEKLKFVGSKNYFKYLPQKFVCDISKAKNILYLDLTFKDIFSKNFFEGRRMSDSDLMNYKNNISTIEYLEQNNDISEKSNYNNFKNMKLKDIYNEYLESTHFENDINNLKDDNENDKYISDYVIKAKNLIDFFYN